MFFLHLKILKNWPFSEVEIKLKKKINLGLYLEQDKGDLMSIYVAIMVWLLVTFTRFN